MESSQEIERGAAEIKIVLEDGAIKIYHSEGPMLGELENAPVGSWDKLWEFMESTLHITRFYR